MSEKSTVPSRTSRSSTSLLSVPEWPLRRKLALVLTIPMLLAAVFGGLRVSDAVRDLNDVQATQEQLSVLHPLVDYFHAVEEAAVVIHSTKAGSPERTEAMARVRATAEELQASRDGAELTGEQTRTLDRTIGASVALQEEEGYGETVALLGQMRMLYAGVQEYTDLVVSDQLIPEPHLPQLAFAIGGRLAFTVQNVQLDRMGGEVRDAYDVYGDLGMEEAALDQLFRIRGAEEILLALSQANEVRREQIIAGEFEQDYASGFALYDELIGGVLTDAEDTLATWSSEAKQDAWVSAGVTAGALLLATLLALFVSRLLVRPVKRVRDGALLVANETLPRTVARIRAGEDPGEIVPIDVTTNEEMGQLARAVDDMHRAAVRLAAGEARIKSQVGEMFVTLSRRNTSLVNQQLSLIESLERDEDDPERLQNLFRLDHLAARMRRTAESLVILSDAPVRQREQSPLAVSDVIQAAAGGVQQYERVQIMGFPTEQVAGTVASDLVHLLTELIDNALSFSPPNSSVDMTTATSSAETVIRVSDSGLGMTDQQLDTLNEMLRSGGEVTPDTARRMGLFVVSRLAQRHGMSVRLATNSRGGVIASVTLPSELLAGRPVELVREHPAPPALVGAPAAHDGERHLPQPPVAAQPAVDPIVAAINAVTGLPQRRPGASRQERDDMVGTTASGMFDRPAPVAPPLATPQPQAPAAAPAPRPVSSSPVNEEGITYRVPLVPRRTVTLPEPTQDPTTRQQEDTAVVTPLPAPQNPFRAPEPDRVVTARPTAAVSDPLRDPYDTIDHGRAPSDPGESPIFASLQSSWLGHGDTWGPAEADAGWRAAEQATEHVEEERTPSGLPQRRPGKRLVPGTAVRAAAPEAATPVRDPEAVRARLSAHVAGVTRGRSASTHTPPNHEEAGPA